jgi:hypothetical protein
LTITRGGEGNDVPAEVIFQDNARAYVRTLQHRDGTTHITVENTAEFHIFDVFSFDAPNMGVATVATSDDFTSHLSQNGSGDALITIKDSGVMSVDSAPIGAIWTGLALSGGNNRGNPPETGGKSTIVVQDNGSFSVQQDLHMTYGFEATAESTLKVVGPDATVAINGSLRMSIDDLDTANPGSSTLLTVITGNSHSTINVGGTAFISEGSLAVELDGYTPTGGEVYTLIAGDIDGSAFRNVDLSMATLLDGLAWDLAINSDSVTLSILGSALRCDFDGDSDCDIDDLDALIADIASGSPNSDFDLTGDGNVDLADRDEWLAQAGSTNLANGNPYLVADANLDGVVDVSDFNTWNASKFTNSGLWSLGDFNADGVSDVTDFNLWNSNKFQASDAAAVPEPATWLPLLFGIIALRRWIAKRPSAS